MEGLVCYNPSSGCDTTGKTLPIKVYSHSAGDCSVTGGYVYRGSRRPEFRGAYIYGDYCTGKISMLRYNAGVVSSDSLLIDSPYLITSFGVDQNNELYILHYSSSAGKIYRFNRSTLVDINGSSSLFPDKYSLIQNYPNPFNPNTIIRFQIPSVGSRLVLNTTLKVYDILGKEIATLVNEKLQPGIYEVPFSNNSITNNQISSGIYFYTLRAGNFTKTKRMMFLK